MRTLLTTLHSKYIHASLALPSLAAYCGSDCGELQIREFTVHQPKEFLLAQICAQKPDVVAFSVYLWNRNLTLELVACLKLIDPELKIVLGGADVSFEKDEFFQRYPVDALICGEGELPLRHLLRAWHQGEQPIPLPGLRVPHAPVAMGQSQLSDLDLLPSPFAAGLVDLSRGLVYFESSRGCPYTCSFCMSALDNQVRSFSLARIYSDLQLLIDAEVPQIKFVDRTFNYQNLRSREIFKFILQQNKRSHFHFEIGGHLLDEESMQLLETVPAGMFQFEIGVQSTLPATLIKIGRNASLDQLAENVRRLRKKNNIRLHLDLIAGLPGEGYQQLLRSLDWTAQLQPHHLQLEPVKVLPGAPLRCQAEELGLVFDSTPPYSILRSKSLRFNELESLRGIGRLLDLLVNSGRFLWLMAALEELFGCLSLLLEDLHHYWQEEDLYQESRSLRDLYLLLDDYLQQGFSGQNCERLRELLGRDFARNQRVTGGTAPAFFNQNLTLAEKELVRQRVKLEANSLERTGKVQYFAAVFEHLPESPGRTILIFLYVTRSGDGQQVHELSVTV